ncbi:MAG: VWA domain-containing protein, partial [Thiomargarita sp.]|nr:VWA domain-containing protein [Thiomargarita sp.]
IDVSGSMGDSLSDMIQAARTVAQELSTENTQGHIRFALTVFHSLNNIKTTLNEEVHSFYTGLKQLSINDGGSDISTAFAPINQLLAQARPNAIKTVIFYTDGNVFHFDKNIQVMDAAKSLRYQGVQLFSVSPPQYDASKMSLITGDPSHILRPSNLQDIVNRFRYITDSVEGLYGHRGQLFQPLGVGNFVIPPKTSKGNTDDTGNIRTNIEYLPFKTRHYSHTLIPQTIGQWAVGHTPPTLHVITPQNKRKILTGERRPQLLVLNFWLLLVFLPALLWMLAYWLRHKGTRTASAYIPPQIRSLVQPTPLPLPASAVIPRKTVVPTLFIGLGGGGRSALFATQKQLKAAHLEAKNFPYRFLYVDLDSNQKQEKDDNIRDIIAPLDICQTSQYLPSAQEVIPPHLKWFHPQNYIEA